MAHRKTKQHTVNVVKANFCASENLSYIDLFDGFNELYTINVATNFKFLADILDLFIKVEFILGNPALIPSTMENTFAMQKIHFKNYIENLKIIPNLWKNIINKN